MTTTTISTTLLESINIVLANLGEAPINSLSGASLPQQVSLSLNTIEEVSTDIQSKGWWFNQKTGNNYDTAANIVIYPSSTANQWSSSIPEEARRYITIRASRIAQTRLIGSEELQKFSYNEELVSLAILQQAHVRNSNGVLDFNSFPTELRGLGVDEVMFLQGSVEEKIGTLRLGSEIATIAKTKAETSLLADQEELVSKQALTEAAKATDVAADTTLKGKQGSLVDAQATTEASQQSVLGAQASNIGADTTLKGAQALLIADQEAKTVAEKNLLDSQKTELDAQNLIGAELENTFLTQVLTGASGSYVDFAAEFRIMGIQETAFQGMPAYKKYELLHDAQTMKTARGLNVVPSGKILTSLNNVLGLIGEPRLTSTTLNLSNSSIASEAYSLLYQTDRELQSRGWWFNTEDNVVFTANSSGQISLASFATLLSVELNDIPHTTIFLDDGSNVRLLKDLNKNSTTSFSGTEKGRVIFLRDIAVNEVPEKYRQYLEVRVAMILTELYPQSGIDVQRLPKMEAELETYFKDREADQANYSVFDNYDVTSRIGINRNYKLT